MPRRPVFWARPIAGALLAAGAACSGGSKPSPRPFTSLSPADMQKPLPSPLPDVAAVVNGEAITSRNVALAARQLTSLVITTEKQGPLMREAMYKLITRELLFQEARDRNLVPDEKAMEQMYNEARVPYKDDAAWKEFLGKQGMDEQTLRTELRVRYTIKALLDQEAGKLPPVDEAQARTFYGANPKMFESGERVKVSQILLRIPAEMPLARRAELRTRLESVLLRARKGEDFAKLAGEYSEDPGSKGKGGQLGVIVRGTLHPNLEKAAFALKPGEVSDVVETPNGFYIIKLTERLPSVKLSFEEVQPKIRDYVTRHWREQGVEQLLNALKGKAHIEIYL